MATSNPTTRKWTVMVFMGATTFEGNVDLSKAAEDDIEEMTAIGSDGTSLDIFVERHNNEDVVQHHIGVTAPTCTRSVPDIRPGMTDGKALTEFVKRSLRTANHGPDDYSMLVLWGHAYDFAFGRKRERDGTVDALDFAELGSSLGAIQRDMFELFHQKRPTSGSNLPVLDIVGFDACDLSTVEMACQLQPYADYLLGSEIGIPIPGWPYDRILHRIRDPKMGKDAKDRRVIGPAEFGTYIVRRFCESYQASQHAVSLTLLDLTRAPELAEHVSSLARRLAVAMGDPAAVGQISDLLLRSRTDEGRPYVDVADLCVNLVRESGDADVIAAATALGDYLVSPGAEVVRCSETGSGRPLIVEHGRNAGRLARLNGISLYAPHVAPAMDVDAAEPFYDKFTFAQQPQNHWKDLVHALARS